MLSRVVMGNINYCDVDVPPDVEGLVKSVTHGKYHSVLGDREKLWGTFREFMVYDRAQIYPEWIIWYRRHFDDGRPERDGSRFSDKRPSTK